jgi:cellulose synthase/poly-beta-1,6-N-acetylglucosamine synthase-like glycosyltransferase
VARMLKALTTSGLVYLALVHGYLLTLLAAATRGRRFPAPTVEDPGRLRFAVLVPARDEEGSIGATLQSLAAMSYPPAQFEVLVLADNCRDRTAEVAAAAGATVWSRVDPSGGSKGATLAWGLERLWAERPHVAAVVVVDADCRVSTNLLTAIEARLRLGANAVQVAYAVANPEASWSSALRFASFALTNTVRPLGKATLGLSSGLFGSGMGFRSDVLRRHPWWPLERLRADLANVGAGVEDHEHHLRLVASGERVAFAPEAWVRSPMPTSLRDSESQQLRWDAGRFALIRARTLQLVASGIRARDPVRLHAGLEPLVPPQSVLFAAGAGAAAAVGFKRPSTRRLAVLAVASNAVFVTGGLALVRAPARVWQALAVAPLFALWKIRLLLRLWMRRAPAQWVKLERGRP